MREPDPTLEVSWSSHPGWNIPPPSPFFISSICFTERNPQPSSGSRKHQNPKKANIGSVADRGDVPTHPGQSRTYNFLKTPEGKGNPRSQKMRRISEAAVSGRGRLPPSLRLEPFFTKHLYSGIIYMP